MQKDIRISVNGKEFDRSIKIDELFRILESKNLNSDLIRVKYASESEWIGPKEFIRYYNLHKESIIPPSETDELFQYQKIEKSTHLEPPPLPLSAFQINQTHSSPSTHPPLTSSSEKKVSSLNSNTIKAVVLFILFGSGFLTHGFFIKEKIKVVEKPIEVVKEVPKIIEKIVEVDNPIPEDYILAHQIYNAMCNAPSVKGDKDNLEGVSDLQVLISLKKEVEDLAGITTKEIKSKLELSLKKSGINVDERSQNVLILNVSIGSNNQLASYNIELSYNERVSIYRPHVIGKPNNDEPNCSDLKPVTFNSTVVPLWSRGYYGVTAKNKFSNTVVSNVDRLATSFANDYLSVNR